MFLCINRLVADTWTLHANEVLRPRVIAYGTATEMEVLDESAFEKVRADFSLTL